MFDAIFEGHFSTVTDTRTASDPWGLGITVDVLRADHDDWKEWQKEHAGQAAEFMEEIGRLASKTAIRSMMLSSVRPGMRQERKKTAAEMEAARDREEGEEMLRAEQIVDRTLEQLPTEKLNALWQSDANAIKPGVAYVLIRRWSGVKDVGGQPIELNLHNALRFVGWEGVLVEYGPGYEPRFMDAVEGKKFEGDTCTVTHFTGNPRKANGELWTCPDGMKYGPAAVGDAITRWLIDESAAGTLARVEALEKSADFLAGTQGGTPATSETVQ